MVSKINEYKYHLKLGFLTALAVLVILFYSFPDIRLQQKIEVTESDIEIYVEDIPKTRQLRTPQKQPTIMASSFIPIPSEIEDLPEELQLDKLFSETGTLGSAAGRVVEIPAKPVLEIYPEVGSLKCQGEIKLLLLVNSGGKVDDIQVLENSTADSRCLEKTKEAALSGKWIPAKVNNENVNSWVVKVYKFNVN